MNRIKFLREEFHFTQEELARKLNLSKGIISLYENEIRKPSYEILIKLSEIFDCSIDYLLCKTENRKLKLDDIKVAFSGGYNALNDTNREIAKSVIESLLAKQEQERKK